MSGYNSPSSPTCGWVFVPEMLASSLGQQKEMMPLRTQTLSDGWQWKQKPKERSGDVESLAEDGGWTSTSVPTEIFKDLLEAGKIEDPHLARNEDKVAWVGEADWMYRTRFPLTELGQNEKVVLVFEGLDTFAKVYLNGVLVLEAQVRPVKPY